MTEDCKKYMLPISALGKSWCDESTDGFIKLIAKNDRLVGAHIVSREASALIHQCLIAIQHNISIDELKEVCFAHPTYSEGIFETLLRL
jgi:dihydrolipoamide dehydrogenase